LDEFGALSALIRRARRRCLSHYLIEQTAVSVALVTAFAILLLIFGTHILSPYWVAALFCASFAIGIYRTRNQRPSPYQLAQTLDRRLGFNDSISTAIHFHDCSGALHVPREMVERQREFAENQARGADLRAGLPFRPPKALYAAAGLACLAIAIFGLRYAVTRSMDLRASLVHMPFTGFFGSEEVASTKKNPGTRTGAERSKEQALSYDPWESKVIDQSAAPDSALNTVDTPDVNNTSSDSASNAKANGKPSKEPVPDQGESAENGENSQSGDQQSNDLSAPDKDGARSAKQQSSAQDNQQSSSSGENSSLSDKMRDALANLMSKLKMNQKAGEGKQGSAQSQNGPQSAQQRQGKDDKGSAAAGKPQSDGMSSPDAQGDQEGQSSDKAQSAQNKSAKGSDKPQSQDGKSGIGKQDGDKTAREAEQLAAMGKISEIIGKRSANVTGEVMVEVASGKQQLKTQYSQKRASHTEAGGEINRDEVPLAYQQYVQQYFEEIRKAPATPPKSKKPSGAAPPS